MPAKKKADSLCVWDVSYNVRNTRIGIFNYHEILAWMSFGVQKSKRKK